MPLHFARGLYNPVGVDTFTAFQLPGQHPLTARRAVGAGDERMSYSTMLYAVDLGELQSAFGSKDSALLERVLAAMQQREGNVKPVDPTTGPRIHVTWNSEIYLNGKAVTPDELRHSMRNPDWEGTIVYLYQEVTAPPGRKREGEYKELGVFMRFLWTLMSSFDERGVMCKKHYIGVESFNTEEDFKNLRSIDDDISEEQALAELIAGKCKRRDNAQAYGYALEHLCGTIGTFLDAVGTDRLKSLKLKTPLSKTRLPVKLPKVEEFPYISYLDAEELRTETARLRAMDMADPQDAEVEQERKRFLQLLENAVEQDRGVVGFYY
jgi:hypothetical protein